MTVMFSVAVDLREDPPRWRATCDRCGQELDVAEDPMVVFRVPDWNEICASEPEMAKEWARRLRDAAMTAPRSVIVDSTVDVVNVERGVGERLLAHARTCERKD